MKRHYLTNAIECWKFGFDEGMWIDIFSWASGENAWIDSPHWQK